MCTVKQVFFCTYKNAETKGIWRKSKEYDTIEALIKAMTPYLVKYPSTSVTYQVSNVYIPMQQPRAVVLG